MSFFLLACVKIPSESPGDFPTIHKTVYVDRSFSSKEKKIINNALDEWTFVTGGIVQWTRREWPAITVEEREVGKECSKHLLIFRSEPQDSAIGLIEMKIQREIRGWATTTSNPCGFETILLLPDRMRTAKELHIITLHEIGHSFGFKHNDKKSVMNCAAPEDVANGVTRFDLYLFCYYQKCNHKKLFTYEELGVGALYKEEGLETTSGSGGN